MGRTVQTAVLSRHVSDVYVSTEDVEIAETARRYGAKIIWRPSELASDTASSEDVLLHVLDTLGHEGSLPAKIVFLQCTSPFTTPEAIDLVISALDDPSFAMSFSVAEDHSFLWGIGSLGEGYGINHDHARLRQRRQDMVKQFRENGAIYVMRTAAFLEQRNRFCGFAKPVYVEFSSLEIDNYEDLIIANAMCAFRTERSRPFAYIAALVMDFDGVHTDDKVHVNQNGEESVVCSRSDGMGVEILRDAGIKMLILSKETNPVVAVRAEKLKIPVLQCCENKKDALAAWLREQGIEAHNVAYIGNDVNDLGCVGFVGWSCCPSDAHQVVRHTVDYVAAHAGGDGAIREIAEFLIKVRGPR